MGLKIKTREIDGELRVAPELMKLLCDLAEHRGQCPICEQFFKTHVGDYCPAGRPIVEEIFSHPDAEYYQDPKS